MKIKYITSILFLTFLKPSYSYISQVDQYNKLTTFGDIHFGSSAQLEHPSLSKYEIAKINEKQANEIINFIKKYPINNSIVLIEDIYDYSEDPKFSKIYSNQRNDNLKMNYVSLLGLLNKKLKEDNIKVVNVEFRQPFALVFSDVIANVSVFLKHFNELVTQIKNYNDTPKLNKYYHETINEIVLKNKSFLELLNKNSNHLIKDFINNDNVQNMNNFVKDYNQLFDLKLMHEIYKYLNEGKQVFVIVGSNHIIRLTNKIIDLGYNTINNIKTVDPKIPLNLNLSPLYFSNLMGNIKFNSIEFISNLILVILALAVPGLINELFVYYRRRKVSYS